jgi:hypothetical protein
LTFSEVQTFTTDPSGQIDSSSAFFQSLGTIHAQAASAPTPDQQKAIVNFEMALSVAQSSDAMAGIPLVCPLRCHPEESAAADDEGSAFRHTGRELSFAHFIFPPRIQTPWPCLARCNKDSAPKIAGSAENG